MKILSPVFTHNQSIPSKYTCDGQNVSPPLEISDVPGETKTLVLIMDDPDAPRGTWVHWTVWNIAAPMNIGASLAPSGRDPKTIKIPENSVPRGAIEGMTDFGKPGYGGPCPPSGTHRYFFKLYALDTELALPPSAKKSDIERALDGHILAHAELIGLYNRIM